MPVVWWLVAAVPGLVACAAPPDAPSSADDARIRARLLDPFVVPRQAVCDELELEISSGFFQELTRPARIQRRAGSADLTTPDEYTLVNDTGLAQPIDLAIGRLRLAVLNRATIRVYPLRPHRLEFHACGGVELVHGGRGERMAEFHIADGQERRVR